MFRFCQAALSNENMEQSKESRSAWMVIREAKTGERVLGIDLLCSPLDR